MARRIAHKLESQWRSNDVLQTDENATFDEFLLSDRVLSGLHKSGFVRPSPIQVQAIPLGLCGFDLVVQAKSGTGKTCVFSTLALQAVDVSRNAVQVLILAPTREIAVQSCDTVCCIGCDIPGLKAYAFIGGVPLSEDLRKLARCHVAVGTLGRLLQLIKQGELRLQHVRLVVLDEADQLLDESFQGDLREVWSRLPPKRQVVATSATYSPEVARTLEEELLHHPAIVRLAGGEQQEKPTLLGMTEWYCVAKGTKEAAWFYRKARALVEILRTLSFSQCLVFLNSQARAQSLVERLSHYGYSAQLLSGAQEQSDRLKALVNLKSFRCRILVATDVAARGIDAERVNLVINFDVARSLDTHLHRSGRAGRYGTAGQTITLVTGRSELNQLLQLCSPLEQDIRPLPGSPSLEPGNDDTELNGDTPEDDLANCSPDGDAAEESSRDFGVNGVAGQGHSGNLGVRDDESEVDPERALEGLLLLFTNDAYVTATEDEVVPQTKDPLQGPTDPSLSLTAAEGKVLPETMYPHQPSDCLSTLAAAKDFPPETEDAPQMPREPSSTLSAIEDNVLPETTCPLQIPTEPLPTLSAAEDNVLPEIMCPSEVTTEPSWTLPAAKDVPLNTKEHLEASTDPSPELTAAKDDVLPETQDPLQVPTEPLHTLAATKDETIPEAAYPPQVPMDLLPLTAAKDIPPEIEDPLQVLTNPSPTLTVAEDKVLPKPSRTVTDPSQPLSAAEDEVLPGTTYLLQVLTGTLTVAKDEVLPETADLFKKVREPSPFFDPFVECRQPEPTGVGPAPNSDHWCNLSWPPKPSLGVELAVHLDAAEEAFRKSFDDSSQLEQMLVAAFKGHPSLFPSRTESEGLDADVRPEDNDVISVLCAVAAADELSFLSEQCCEPSSVAVNSEDAGAKQSCVGQALQLAPTSTTLELEGPSSREAGEDMTPAPCVKAVTCEMLHPSQLHQETGPVASSFDAATVTDIASEESFVSCCSHPELSGIALDSKVVSVVLAQGDGIALNLKPAAEEVAKQESSSVTLNSDLTGMVDTEAATKKGPLGLNVSEELRKPGLSHTQNGVISAVGEKAVADNHLHSYQERPKPEAQLEVADVNGANVPMEGHPYGHSVCQKGSGPGSNSNRIKNAKVPDKSSTQGPVKKRKDIATWIMETSNLAGIKKDATTNCSQRCSASLKSKQSNSEELDTVKSGKVRTPQKKSLPATENVSSTERVRNIPSTVHQEWQQRKVDTSSESEDSDSRLSVQFERHKRPSCPESSHARCSSTTYLEHPTTSATRSPSHCTNRSPMYRTDMCDRCARECDAIRAACCKAQRSMREAAVSSPSCPYTRTHVHTSGWYQNWFHWYEWYIREMLRVNSYQ